MQIASATLTQTLVFVIECASSAVQIYVFLLGPVRSIILAESWSGNGHSLLCGEYLETLLQSSPSAGERMSKGLPSHFDIRWVHRRGGGVFLDRALGAKL
eukprot:3077374-Amphidinium_carterae.1